jgi:hypothetical protein
LFDAKVARYGASERREGAVAAEVEAEEGIRKAPDHVIIGEIAAASQQDSGFLAIRRL